MKLKQIRVDGYKNLINCVLDLGDFNVLVGPNNSGKSNLLEAIQMLWPICFGDEKLREKIFKGLTPSSRFGFSMSHLNKYANKPITIGVCFEVQVEGNLWVADYEVKVQCAYEKKDNRGFIHETLKAKRPNRPGPAIEYISRDEEKFKVHGATYEISKSNPSLQAVRSIYPDFKGLPTEFLAFYTAIGLIGLTRIFAFSPKGLRNDIGSENDIESTACTCVSSFDLTLLADKIKEEGKLYNLFVQSLCHILDLEQVELEVEDVKPGKEKGKDVSKRMRFFFMQRCGDCYALINEYSDGTLVVVGILEALFCEESRGIILCIEELENCLHPGPCTIT